MCVRTRVHSEKTNTSAFSVIPGRELDRIWLKLEPMSISCMSWHRPEGDFHARGPVSGHRTKEDGHVVREIASTDRLQVYEILYLLCPNGQSWAGIYLTMYCRRRKIINACRRTTTVTPQRTPSLHVISCLYWNWFQVPKSHISLKLPDQKHFYSLIKNCVLWPKVFGRFIPTLSGS